MNRAHPAITPLDLKRTEQDLIAAGWPKEHVRVFDLVRRLSLAALGPHPVIEERRRLLELAGGATIAFGWRVIREQGWRSQLPSLPLPDPAIPFAGSSVTGPVHIDGFSVETVETSTQPDLGGLVEIMKSKGFGTPSTYASTITRLIERSWLSVTDDGLVEVTSEGRAVAKRLLGVKELPQLNAAFSKHMEETLQQIENGTIEPQDALEMFTSLLDKQTLLRLLPMDGHFAGELATDAYARRDDLPIEPPQMPMTTADPENDLLADDPVRLARTRLFDALARACGERRQGLADRQSIYAIEAAFDATTVDEQVWKQRSRYDALVRWAFFIEGEPQRNPEVYRTFAATLDQKTRVAIESAARDLAQALWLANTLSD